MAGLSAEEVPDFAEQLAGTKAGDVGKEDWAEHIHRLRTVAKQGPAALDSQHIVYMTAAELAAERAERQRVAKQMQSSRNAWFSQQSPLTPNGQGG